MASRSDHDSLLFLLYSDLFRYYGRFSFKLFLKEMLLGVGYKYTFWLRLTNYFFNKSNLFKPLFYMSFVILRHYMFKFGVEIGYCTKIGPGFYIGHQGGIVINKNAVIGKNCNISQGVTIGQSNRGDKKGAPVIGNNVFIGPGAKIIGKIRVGDGACVGANAVVTRDIEMNSVVGGIPARVLSTEGSVGYVNRTDY